MQEIHVIAVATQSKQGKLHGWAIVEIPLSKYPLKGTHLEVFACSCLKSVVALHVVQLSPLEQV